MDSRNDTECHSSDQSDEPGESKDYGIQIDAANSGHIGQDQRAQSFKPPDRQ